MYWNKCRRNKMKKQQQTGAVTNSWGKEKRRKKKNTRMEIKFNKIIWIFRYTVRTVTIPFST